MTAAVLTLLLPCGLLAAADPQAAVESGRQALDKWSGYPWYDAATDGIRRVDLSPPRNWNLSAPSWIDTFFLVLFWVLVFGLLAVLAYLLIRTWLQRRAAPETPEVDVADAGRIEVLPFPVEPGKLDLLGEARRHYEEGNYGKAIVFLFSFQLVQLDRRQIIRLTRGKTNRQYLRELGPHLTLREVVQQTMVAFEDVFFGNHTLERGRFEACWSRVGEFQALAGEGT